MPSIESVQQLLASETFGDRIAGLNQLRAFEPKEAFPLIQPLLKDKEARVRYAAVSQMDAVGVGSEDEALVLLRDSLNNDSEIDVKAAAADAIAGLKITEAYPDLEATYRSTSEWLLQFSIVAALGELGDPRAFDLLKEALQSENELIRTSAISALGDLGDRRAIDLLIPFVEDDDWQIRYRVAQAFGRIGGDETKPYLEKFAADEQAAVADEAKHHLQ
ncbi:PBS lyase HEAT domain protein repeat-containing protein [[Leptolyngbya] sp. PCC 7376]|uniref:phycobilisome degradation protein NblB n=1 Tax=[Leptolyngbya] sp. PCC 7376 TaxID=111781 RepID=UPI00029EF919|nr:HEAT repeat domain-containing protein [[Leptolyngbya] sp. PCC 7376]AFY36984.1 PBS lyase HEAT domain protein repeat-containing protein [[Leptolyngbya] sp. PCC 7376]